MMRLATLALVFVAAGFAAPAQAQGHCPAWATSCVAPAAVAAKAAPVRVAHRRGAGVSLAGVVAPLAAKAREIVAACGARIISAVRHTRVRGSGRLSLHASGRAVDIAGNPGCIYRHLAGWPGGVSTDYHRIRPNHVHVSYSPGGREWGTRFAHWRPRKKRRARFARR